MNWRQLSVVAGMAILCTGCSSQRFERLETRAGQLEERNTELTSRVTQTEKRLAQMDKLAVDMESVRAYFKDVSDRVSAMRTDIVGLIDDQRVRLDEGRKEYLRILHRQKDVLDSMSKDLDTAIKELEKETRKPEDTVAKEPLPPTLINTPSEPQTGAAPPTP